MEVDMPDKEGLPWIYQQYINIDWDNIDYEEFMNMSNEFDDDFGSVGMEFIDFDNEPLDWQSISDIVYSIEQSIFDEQSKRLINEVDTIFEQSLRDTSEADQMLRDIGIKLNE